MARHRSYRFIFSWNGGKSSVYMNYHDKWGPIQLNKFNLTKNKKESFGWKKKMKKIADIYWHGFYDTVASNRFTATRKCKFVKWKEGTKINGIKKKMVIILSPWFLLSCLFSNREITALRTFEHKTAKNIYFI